MANSTKRWSFSDSVGALAGLLMKCTIATTTMPSAIAARLPLCSVL
jgi:hypothetical protein